MKAILQVRVLIIVFTALRFLSAAQTSALRTLTIDGETGDTMPFATVQLKDSVGNFLRAGTSDCQGELIFRDLQPGHYMILATNVGFERREIKNIRIRDKRTSRISVEFCAAEAVNIQEVAIVASSVPLIDPDMICRSIITRCGRNVCVFPWVKNDTTNSQDDMAGRPNLHSSLISVYPNPCNSVLHISVKSRGDEAFLFDLSGVMLGTTQGENGKFEFDVSSLTPGIYVVRIGQERDALAEKVIVQK